MPTDADDIKLRLLDSHAEFRQLAAQHQDLDQRLSSLSTKPYLTDDEQVEEVTLKKKKLQPQGSHGRHPAASPRDAGRAHACALLGGLRRARLSSGGAGPQVGPRRAVPGSCPWLRP